MATVILTVHLLLALGLIIVVLLQRSEGGGLGVGGGGGVMTGRGAASALSKVTWGFGIAFVATSLVLTVIAARESGSQSVLDRIQFDPGQVGAPTVPDGDDLLPPIGPSAPNVPPQDGPAMPPVQE